MEGAIVLIRVGRQLHLQFARLRDIKQRQTHLLRFARTRQLRCRKQVVSARSDASKRALSRVTSSDTLPLKWLANAKLRRRFADRFLRRASGVFGAVLKGSIILIVPIAPNYIIFKNGQMTTSQWVKHICTLFENI